VRNQSSAKTITRQNPEARDGSSCERHKAHLRKHDGSDSRFRKNILTASKNNFSRIILALDLQGSSQTQLLRTGKSLIENTASYICAIKLGRQTVLNLGMEKSRTLIATSHANELPCIIDEIGRASCRER